MIPFKKLARPPAGLRDAYLDSLAEPQELFLELQVEAGVTWLAGDFAYAVVFDSKLVEFFVAPERASRTVEAFDAVMKASGASTVIAKSWDTRLLYAAFATKAHVRTGGLLFRRIADQTFQARDDVTFRQGVDADAQVIYSFNDDFFESVEEIQQYASIGGLFVLEREGEAVGCGIGRPVIDGRSDIDIGMLVAKGHRRKGYGGHIIAYLKSHYLALGLRPICGCSVDNIGSQRALWNAGFVSEHSVLEISY